MTATATIITASRKDALLVPNAALRFKPASAEDGRGRGLHLADRFEHVPVYGQRRLLSGNRKQPRHRCPPIDQGPAHRWTESRRVLRAHRVTGSGLERSIDVAEPHATACVVERHDRISGRSAARASVIHRALTLVASEEKVVDL